MLPKIIVVVVILTLGFFVFNRPSRESGTPPVISSTGCTGIPTPAQTEGPYYKAGSPQRNNIAEGVVGDKLTVTGFVFDKNCKPVANAWLDFWHADGHGIYDNTGFKLRGYQFTDSEGKYTLETIVPAAYGGRPPHIHVKVRATDGPILTSQLYFPGAAQNKSDSVFNQALIMDISEGAGSKVGSLNFMLVQ